MQHFADCFYLISILNNSQIIQGGLQAQLGPASQSAPQPVKEVDESLKLRIHQVLKLLQTFDISASCESWTKLGKVQDVQNEVN